jgi:flagellar motor switch protein FliG
VNKYAEVGKALARAPRAEDVGVGAESPETDARALSNLFSNWQPQSDVEPMEGLPDISRMAGATKAAILIMRLGRDQSSKILRHLKDNEVAAVMSEVARMQNVPPDMVAAVIREFRVIKDAQQYVASGGVDYARDLLEDALGAEKAKEILERLHVSLYDAPFEFLRKADPRQVLGFLKDEHPQTIALVLAHMSSDSAGMVLSGLDEDLQQDVAVRLAVMDRTSPDIIAAVEESLQKRVASVLQESEFSTAGGVGALVEILNRADRSTERLIFEGLEDFDSELADEVRSRMFVFEDIVNLDDRSVQLILRQVDSKQLAVALKGVRNEVRQKIFVNVSQRAAQNLQEEIDLLGAVRLKTVEESQAGVVRVIRALEEAGQIVVMRGTDEFIT